MKALDRCRKRNSSRFPPSYRVCLEDPHHWGDRSALARNFPTLYFPKRHRYLLHLRRVPVRSRFPFFVRDIQRSYWELLAEILTARELKTLKEVALDCAKVICSDCGRERCRWRSLSRSAGSQLSLCRIGVSEGHSEPSPPRFVRDVRTSTISPC